MGNDVRNGEQTQFSSENQPSGDAKSKGWERKRLAKEFMDEVYKLQEMSIVEFEELSVEMEKKKSAFTIRQLLAKNYIQKIISSEKLMLDWIDRNLGKPPKFDLEEEEREENRIDKIEIEIINTHKTFDAEGHIVDIPFTDEEDSNLYDS